jgi:hypothetical protein
MARNGELQSIKQQGSQLHKTLRLRFLFDYSENNAGRFFTNNPYNNQVQYHNTEKAFVNKPLVPK